MNLFVIINDGFRWQEVFSGADPGLLNDPKLVADPLIKEKFSGSTELRRRQKLLPFLWRVIAKEGVLHGNRKLNSKVNTANLNAASYPGYNEIFTGKTNFVLVKNDRRYNRNKNVLEYLHAKPAFKNKIAVFTSWDKFPYVLNKKNSGIYFNSGSKARNDNVIHARNMTLKKDKKAGTRSQETRYDHITYHEAKKYIQDHHPRVVVIAFGEGDVQAHQKRYDLYLQKANEIDGWAKELWNMLQADPHYRNNTDLLLCTDHGRGAGTANWYEHGLFVRGSSQVWLALLGPGVNSLRFSNKNQLYNKQLPSIMAGLVGESF